VLAVSGYVDAPLGEKIRKGLGANSPFSPVTAGRQVVPVIDIARYTDTPHVRSLGHVDFADGIGDSDADFENTTKRTFKLQHVEAYMVETGSDELGVVDAISIVDDEGFEHTLVSGISDAYTTTCSKGFDIGACVKGLLFGPRWKLRFRCLRIASSVGNAVYCTIVFEEMD
jgi:hypothetical protein